MCAYVQLGMGRARQRGGCVMSAAAAAAHASERGRINILMCWLPPDAAAVFYGAM